MNDQKLLNKGSFLYLLLVSFLVCNALIAEFIGIKIFSLEKTLGFEPYNWGLFGVSGNFSFTAGVILWPVVFILTDLVNEYFGRVGVRLASFLTVALIIYAFIMVYWSISLSPADWWINIQQDFGIENMQYAFEAVFGQGLWIIAGSLVAFLLGQLLDVSVFHFIKKKTGDRSLWLRATGSTLVSQLIDSLVVLYIAFVLGPQQWDLNTFFAIALVNYCYKASVAIILTPLLYLAHHQIDQFLGKDLSDELKTKAMSS